MSLEFDATYRDGAIHPPAPLELPENAPVRVVVAAKPGALPPTPFPTTREDVLAIRPHSPRFTAEDLNARLEKFSVSVGSLPPDFSRADIYSDND